MTFKTIINFQHLCLKNILTKILFLTRLTLQLFVENYLKKVEQKKLKYEACYHYSKK